jgi:undecaprenyl-diphosphatase
MTRDQPRRAQQAIEPPRRTGLGRGAFPPRRTNPTASRVARIAALDEQLLRQIASRRAGPLTCLLRALCRLLDPPRIAMVVCVLILAGPVAHDVATHLFWALVSTGIVVAVTKRLVRRHRPALEIQALEPPDKYSFPSGHAAAGFALAIAMFGAVPLLAPVFVVVAIVVAYARMYLGVHYPIDVLAGVCIGVFTGSVVALLPLV